MRSRIEILNPLNHFTKTKVLAESHLKDLLKIMKGYKFIETLEVTFKKKASYSKTGKRENIYKTAFFNGKAKTITNANETESELSISQQELEYNIQVLTIEMTGRKPLCIRVQITAVTSAFYFMPVLCVLYSKTLKR